MRNLVAGMMMVLSCAPSLAQETADPVWVLSQGEGPAIATFGPPGGPPLVSIGCDKTTRELVVFRAVSPPAEQTEMTMATEAGELRLAASADPAGTPGVIARAPAADAFVAQLGNAATITFRVSGEEGDAGGIAAPVGEPLRQVLMDCTA